MITDASTDGQDLGLFHVGLIFFGECGSGLGGGGVSLCFEVGAKTLSHFGFAFGRRHF